LTIPRRRCGRSSAVGAGLTTGLMFVVSGIVISC
jgi:hypothetical protein